VRIKLNALAATVKDKRVILVDDSIVRGTTSSRIVKLLRNAGAKEVHMKVTAPPFLNPCYFGTHIPDRKDLAAADRSVEEVCQLIGADSLQYLSLEDLSTITQGLNVGICDACFTGHYTVPVPKDKH
jgi:amidophosphoribosyltransferase